MNAIEVQNLTKRYGDQMAVDGLSFSVEPGRIYGLLGPNGAGKTTAVECIEGLRKPDAGIVRVLGLDPAADGPAVKARLGVQLQTTGLFPKLTVREIIDLYASFFPRAVSTNALLKRMGLQEKAKTLSSHLSGGQRQKLTLALALVGDPEILFLDEPTTAMDPAARREVWEIVRSLKASGKTVVLTTHYMEEAGALCDTVAVVDRGRILAAGNPASLVREHFAETAIEFATPDPAVLNRLRALPGVARLITENGTAMLLSTDVPETVAGLLARSKTDGFALDRFTVRSATLEDLFLRLTGRKIREQEGAF